MLNIFFKGKVKQFGANVKVWKRWIEIKKEVHQMCLLLHAPWIFQLRKRSISVLVCYLWFCVGIIETLYCLWSVTHVCMRTIAVCCGGHMVHLLLTVTSVCVGSIRLAYQHLLALRHAYANSNPIFLCYIFITCLIMDSMPGVPFFAGTLEMFLITISFRTLWSSPLLCIRYSQ